MRKTSFQPRSEIMSLFIRLVLGSVAAATFLSAPAYAAAQRPFDQQAFKAAQESGKPILVEIHADWCPTCKAQLPILDKVSNEPKFSNLVRFRVDFDSQKDLVRQFKGRIQSTLVLYRGRSEVARSVGETDEARIRAMLAKAL
jgi:thioredoxin